SRRPRAGEFGFFVIAAGLSLLIVTSAEVLFSRSSRTVAPFGLVVLGPPSPTVMSPSAASRPTLRTRSTSLPALSIIHVTFSSTPPRAERNALATPFQSSEKNERIGSKADLIALYARVAASVIEVHTDAATSATVAHASAIHPPIWETTFEMAATAS